MKSPILAAFALVAAATIAATAGAAPPPNKAKTLALQKKHFPPGVTARDAAGDVNPEGSGYSVTYEYRRGGRPYELSVSVLAFKSPAMAVRMFKEFRGDVLPSSPKLTLPPPRYGHEQVASHSILGGSQLLVRTGAVIWMLLPQTYMVRRGKEYELTKAQTLALYRQYGRIQQRLVGRGS